MIVQGNPVGEWVSSKVGGMWIPQGSVAIGQEKNGELVAGCIFDNYCKSSIRSTLAVDGRMSREFVREILRYPFDYLGVNCVINTVSSANTKSLRLTEHFGFKRVATIPLAMPDGDMVIYSLSRNDCQRFMR